MSALILALSLVACCTGSDPSDVTGFARHWSGKWKCIMLLTFLDLRSPLVCVMLHIVFEWQFMATSMIGTSGDDRMCSANRCSEYCPEASHRLVPMFSAVLSLILCPLCRFGAQLCCRCRQGNRGTWQEGSRRFHAVLGAVRGAKPGVQGVCPAQIRVRPRVHRGWLNLRLEQVRLLTPPRCLRCSHCICPDIVFGLHIPVALRNHHGIHSLVRDKGQSRCYSPDAVHCLSCIAKIMRQAACLLCECVLSKLWSAR